jgi:hypothetical protein
VPTIASCAEQGATLPFALATFACAKAQEATPQREEGAASFARGTGSNSLLLLQEQKAEGGRLKEKLQWQQGKGCQGNDNLFLHILLTIFILLD